MLSITEARGRLLNLASRVHRVSDRVVLTRRGRPETVLMSYEEYEGWQETLEILANPRLTRRILRASREVRKGRTIPLERVLPKTR